MTSFIGKKIALVLLGSAVATWAQSGQYLPTNINNTASAVQAYEIQGEYVGVTSGGDTLGAHVVARGNNSYFLALLPGGLVPLPGRYDDGAWNGVQRFTGTATWSASTGAYAVTTGAGYSTTSITEEGGVRFLNGTTSPATGSQSFSLQRVVRSSPTLGLKPNPAWGEAVHWFDSAAAAANSQGELSKWIPQNTTPQLHGGGYLYRGVRTSDTHGAGFLHVEVMSPFRPTATGQNRGNSGVYLQSKYEVQVLDSFGLTPQDDEAGSIYGVSAPLINPSLPPMVFTTYDIYFTPRTSGSNGTLAGAAVMTVYMNGVLIQDSVPVPVTTEAGLGGSQLNPAGLYLQDHGNNVVFNNVWFVPAPAAGMTHDQLRQVLPYESVLEEAGVVSLRSFNPRPRTEFRDASGAGRFFDLMGRRVHDQGVPLKVVPAPAR
jgi:hypothetical protein